MNLYSRNEKTARVARQHLDALKTLDNHPMIRLAYEQGVRDADELMKREQQGLPQQDDGEFTYEEVRDAAELLVATGELSRIDAEKRVSEHLADLVAHKRSRLRKRATGRQQPKA